MVDTTFPGERQESENLSWSVMRSQQDVKVHTADGNGTEMVKEDVLKIYIQPNASAKIDIELFVEITRVAVNAAKEANGAQVYTVIDLTNLFGPFDVFKSFFNIRLDQVPEMRENINALAELLNSGVMGNYETILVHPNALIRKPGGVLLETAKKISPTAPLAGTGAESYVHAFTQVIPDRVQKVAWVKSRSNVGGGAESEG